MKKCDKNGGTQNYNISSSSYTPREYCWRLDFLAISVCFSGAALCQIGQIFNTLHLQ